MTADTEFALRTAGTTTGLIPVRKLQLDFKIYDYGYPQINNAVPGAPIFDEMGNFIEVVPADFCP